MEAREDLRLAIQQGISQAIIKITRLYELSMVLAQVIPVML